VFDAVGVDGIGLTVALVAADIALTQPAASTTCTV